MKRLNRKEFEDLRLYIADLCRVSAYSVLLDENGRFSLHNVSESDAYMMVNNLRNDIMIKEASYHPTGYDFSHFDPMGIPKQEYTVQGLADIENENIDDDISDLNI